MWEMQSLWYKSLSSGFPLELLYLASDFRFDLVLLYVMLPGLDGFSLSQIHSLDTPVIFLSAIQQVADKVRGLCLEAED